MAVDRNVPRSGRSGRGGRRNRPARQARFTPIVPVEPDGSAESVEPESIIPGPPRPKPAKPEPERAPVESVPLGDLTARKLPVGLITHDDLERQEREAAALHAQASELRARLDAPPPPLTPHRRRRLFAFPPRRVALAILAVLVLIAVVVVGTRLPWASGGAPVPEPFEPASVGDTQPQAPAVPRYAIPAGLNLPGSGPGIDQVGTALGLRLVGQLDSPARVELGKVRVAQRVVLPAAGPTTVVLARSATPGLNGNVAALRPVVSGLRAEVNGATAKVERSGAGWVVSSRGATDGARARVLLLRYDVGETIAVSAPSTSGRALGLVSPLTVKGAQPAALQAQTGSSQVIGMVCPGTSETQMLCGRTVPKGWRASVPADSASQALLLQLDLKRG